MLSYNLKKSSQTDEVRIQKGTVEWMVYLIIFEAMEAPLRINKPHNKRSWTWPVTPDRLDIQLEDNQDDQKRSSVMARS